MKITFLGAAHEVTGSCTMLELGGRYVLVDCGMEQGRDTFVSQEIPVEAARIDCVLLTHAHVDHSGRLPLLYKQGFRGTVYATEATYHLCEIMLLDCAHILESEVERENRKGRRSGGEAAEPLYTTKDAQGVLGHFRPCNYEEEIRVLDDTYIRFLDAGHLLGSASIEVWSGEGENKRKLVFSGDIGNPNKPIISDPQPAADADYVIMESTYGNRLHKERLGVVADLEAFVERTLERGGNVVMPSFAVGRTQEMLYLFRHINNERQAAGKSVFPVYLDSPLANEATGVFLQCDPSYFDGEMRKLLNQGINPLMFESLHIAAGAEESRAINEDLKPKVIISASGMCEAGRVRHHLKHNLWREDCMVLFVGYQANGTLGRLLIDGVKHVRLFGDDVSVRAEIGLLKGVSGHADKDGLIRWICAMQEKPKRVFINHGDDDACKELAATLADEYGYQTAAPHSGTVYDLITGEVLVQTDGVLAENRKKSKETRAEKAFQRLLSAIRRLTDIAKLSEGMANKDLARFADQIDQIASKMQR